MHVSQTRRLVLVVLSALRLAAAALGADDGLAYKIRSSESVTW
jgi:hypothetical protein